MSTEQQTTIDWTAEHKLAILRAATFPHVKNRALLKLLLRLIYDYSRRSGECYLSQANLALEADVSEKTIERAVAKLVQLGVITCERESLHVGRRTGNHYRIVWSELALLGYAPINPTVDEISIRHLEPINPTVSTDQSDTWAISNRQNSVCLHEAKKLIEPTTELEASAVVVDFENSFTRQSRELSPSPPSLPEAALGSLATQERAMTHQFRPTQKRLGSGQPEKRWQKPKPKAPTEQPLLSLAEQPAAPPPVPANVWNRNPVTGLMNSQWSDYDQQRIFDALCACGLSGALEILKQRIIGGMTVAEMDQVIEQWHQQKLWGTFKEPVGALHHRLTQLVWPCKLKLGPDAESSETPDSEADREKFRGTVLSMMHRGLKAEEIVRQALAKRYPLDKIRAWWPYQQLDFPPVPNP